MLLFLILAAASALLPFLFLLALKLRLGVPMLYAALMLTAFHGWYQTHTALADGIFFALVALAALSWAVTAGRKLYDVFDGFREERAMADLLAERVRQARTNGESVVNTDGLW